MFLNSITNEYSKNLYTNKSCNTNFNGKKALFRENELKALLSQDIWSPELRVRMPQSAEEKKVLIEILTKRLELDELVKLTNNKFKLLTDYNYLNSLIKNDPNNSQIPELRETLLKDGDVTTRYNEMDETINMLKKQHKTAYDYLVNLGNMSEKLIDNHIITIGKMQKFWDSITKNNINPDGKLSTKEILEQVTNCKIGENNTEKAASTKTSPILTKGKAISNIENSYEQALLESLNIYQPTSNHSSDVKYAKKNSEQFISTILKHFPEIKNQLANIYDRVEKKIMNTVIRLINVKRVVDGNIVQGVQVHPLDRVWQDMDERVKIAKNAIKEIETIKSELVKKPNDDKLKSELNKQNAILNEAKSDWLELLDYSVKWEVENQKLFDEADRLRDYSYLTSKNAIIKQHRELYNLVKENQNTMPEEKWAEIFA